MEYRDMPLEKVSSIENFWHSRNYLKIFASLILVFISFGFFYFGLIMPYIFWILAFIFIIIGIILILNCLTKNSISVLLSNRLGIDFKWVGRGKYVKWC